MVEFDSKSTLYIRDGVVVRISGTPDIYSISMIDFVKDTMKHLGILNMKTHTYTKGVDETKHYFKKFHGYGISLTVINALKAFNIEHVELIECRTGRVYKFKVSQFTSELVNKYDNVGDIQHVVPIMECSDYMPEVRV